jgi:hypothetical protein
MSPEYARPYVKAQKNDFVRTIARPASLQPRIIRLRSTPDSLKHAMCRLAWMRGAHADPVEDEGRQSGTRP